MWECVKFEVHLGHAEEDPEQSWIRSRPEELLTGLMLEKPATEVSEYAGPDALMSKDAHWPVFWRNVVADPDGWAEFEGLMRKGYDVYVALHEERQWFSWHDDDRLRLVQEDHDELAERGALRHRLKELNASRGRWAGVFVFARWWEPGREHILGHDGEVLNWVLDRIDELMPLYRLSVPVDFPFPERPSDLEDSPPDDFWEQMRDAGAKDGRRGDRYVQTGKAIVRACERVEEEFHGFHCGWQKGKDRLSAFLNGERILSLYSDGKVRVVLKAVPESMRTTAAESFREQFSCSPASRKLYVRHFLRFRPAQELFDWLRLAGRDVLRQKE
jgi:hypothetical protein